MNRLGQAKCSALHFRRVFSLMFSGALVLISGSPLTAATAEPVPLLRDVSQSGPYVDCGAAPGRIAKLGNRLAERRKAIDKTKSMLPGLEDGSKKAWSRADQIMSEAPANLMTSFASDYMTTTTNLKNRIRALRDSGASKEKVELWLKSMKGM